MRLRLGLSTCPNDTFAFHALRAREVDWRGIEFEFELADVEQLNERMLAGALDASKVSFHAALQAGARWCVLEAGAALGFGVGPLLLAPGAPTTSRRVLAPGRWTTAQLLWRLFHAGEGEAEQVVFSAIVPALERGEAALGVCIHEARFTWAARGLRLVEDLGERWERETHSPLPLGGIAARADLGEPGLVRLAACVRDSLEWGLAHRDACLPTMSAQAQEFDERVLWQHVELYVNSHTLELGELGRRGLDELARRAQAAPLRIVAPPPESRPRLFHLSEPAALQRLSSGEPHAPASLAGEGFVHLSRAAQLAATLERHFAAARHLVLLELDRARAEPALRWERSRGGEPFPHLYRALERADLVRAWELQRSAGERWPTLLLPRDPRGDRPAAALYFGAGTAPGATVGAP
jgi:1,4-dihydroxy-6-naphthoate synthase